MRQALSKFDREYLEERERSAILVDEKTAIMSQAELDRLANYSATLPTGTFVGKRWKRAIRDHRRQVVRWVMGEYAPNPDPGLVDIIWRDVELLES